MRYFLMIFCMVFASHALDFSTYRCFINDCGSNDEPCRQERKKILQQETIKSMSEITYCFRLNMVVPGSISNIAMVSRPYVTVTNATYYPGNTTTPQSINDAFPNTGANMNIIKLGADQFYGVANYCPLYVPSSSNTIDNPMDAESFFLTQHPYNRFTLPRMSSMNNLTISPASLTR